MSGTSMDGADAIVVTLANGALPQRHAFVHIDFSPALRDELFALNAAGDNELHRSARAENALADAYVEATTLALREAGLRASDIKAIGCHGQTVRHRPELGYTIQLNNAARLAYLTGIDVVSDFRARDVAAGGQGAPLAPAFHDGMFRHPTETRVVANIGGIANLTILTPGESVWGFDCGPGNCLMDLWASRQLGQPYDANGAWAASGVVLPRLLTDMQAEAYFTLPAPKSTGRDLFHAAWLDAHLARAPGEAKPADVQATLLALTTWGIASHVLAQATNAARLIVCGGGAFNTSLLHALSTALPKIRVEASDTHGVPAQEVEALAFAWLAQQCVEGRAIDLRRTTGAAHPGVLGALTRA
jgi:anhydro-N-acetylmuramic acid kinase